MTTSALEKSLSQARTFSSTTFQTSLRLRQAGTGNFGDLFSDLGGFSGGFGSTQEKRGQRESYANFRGWLYSAVNAIATEGAGQTARVGRLVGQESSEVNRSAFSSSKAYGEFLRSKMPKSTQKKLDGLASLKTARSGVELIQSGELVDLVDCPNDIQNRWQFTYSFITNLCLTGWSYLIKDISEDGAERPQMFSVPTTWVTPNHTNGPFSSIVLKNPKKPGSQGQEYDRTQFAFAHLPNPSDPLSAIAPASAQAISIRIDDHIQTSQEAFFHNGIFPSVLVTIGKLPLGESGGVRPRLSGSQRRQVHGAIRKSMGSIANYGNPGILDGLVERIDRLSATQNEMGWEKSEKTTRLRILSAFAIHPFILGEEMAGSYAQAYTVLERFCNRVNTYLDLLGVVLTNFFAQEVHGVGTDNLIWWEPCEPKDPDQDRRWWETAANKNYVTQNEFRNQIGLPPDEDSNQQYMDRLMAAEVNKLLVQLGKGLVSREQALAFLQTIGLPTNLAEIMASPPPIPEPDPITPLVEDIQGTLQVIRSQAGLLTL